MPVNVLSNWKDEIDKWQKACSNRIKVFNNINDKQNSKLAGNDKIEDRLVVLKNWFDKGGVLLMGYTIFTRIISGKKLSTVHFEEFKKYLTNPGPDLIVCDEGHQLKNLNSEVNKAVNKMTTKRRIVLTGTPLQNNLGELFTMVSFIKPNLLGTLQEFRNRFENPIKAGQHRDSTEFDVRQMKKRSHILNNTIDPFVNRKDYSFFKSFLPPKMEYVLSIRLSSKQIEFYRSYLHKNGIDNLNNESTIKSLRILNDFHQVFSIYFLYFYSISEYKTFSTRYIE
jgi:transcriptional regulator ATRX